MRKCAHSTPLTADLLDGELLETAKHNYHTFWEDGRLCLDGNRSFF